MSVNVPDLLTLSKDITFEIKDEAGNIIGTAVANHLTGVVTVTFLKLVENATSDIKGSFSVWVNWDEQKVEEDTRVVVDWKDGGTTEVNIGRQQDRIKMRYFINGDGLTRMIQP